MRITLAPVYPFAPRKARRSRHFASPAPQPPPTRRPPRATGVRLRQNHARRTRMRIAIDIDSTLHHYWDRLSAAALRRFGVELPYEEQLDWGITRLRQDQLHLCIQETHSEAAI